MWLPSEDHGRLRQRHLISVECLIVDLVYLQATREGDSKLCGNVVESSPRSSYGRCTKAIAADCRRDDSWLQVVDVDLGRTVERQPAQTLPAHHDCSQVEE